MLTTRPTGFYLSKGDIDIKNFFNLDDNTWISYCNYWRTCRLINVEKKIINKLEKKYKLDIIKTSISDGFFKVLMTEDDYETLVDELKYYA